MNLTDARYIAEDLRLALEPGCVPRKAEIVGSVRRKRADVRDIEILVMPILRAPRPEFGQTVVFETIVDKLLYELVKGGRLFQPLQNGPKKKTYPVNLEAYNLKNLNPFHFELYLVTPPAQWGVLALIRTGPARQEDHFSKWCVTNRNMGGLLPDGYVVKHGAVWNVDQVDHRREPRPGEMPLEMPDEQSFFKFLGMEFIEPQERHARWRRMAVR